MRWKSKCFGAFNMLEILQQFQLSVLNITIVCCDSLEFTIQFDVGNILNIFDVSFFYRRLHLVHMDR